MGRRAHHRHARTAEGADTALCGDSGMWVRWADGGPPSCPGCSAAYWRARLPDNVTLTKGINVRDDGRGWKEYRGVHELRIDGVLYGYVCSGQGFGVGFTVHHATNADYQRGMTCDGRIEIDTAELSLTFEGKSKKRFDSKEHAAFYALSDMRERPEWCYLKPPMEQSDYIAKREAERLARAEAEKKRVVEFITSQHERAGQLSRDALTCLAHMQALRALNVESDAAVAAIAYALARLEKEYEDLQRSSAHATAVAERTQKEGKLT